MNTIQRRIDAAMGRSLCDLIIQNVRFLDVFTCEWKEGDVAIAGGAIVGLEPGLKARRVIDGRHRWLVPGFIDAHVHVESSLLVPANFERAVLPRGTTTAVCDPHELTNVLGPEALRFFLDAAEKLSLDLRVMLSSCVPATNMETNGGGIVGAAMLKPYLSHPKALGLAEMMNVPGVLGCDPEVLAKLEAFSGRPIDGHCPKVTGRELSAYASAGIASCHESSTLPEAREKLTKGIACWIREGSVAKDLDALIPILTPETSAYVGFCTDDRNPLDIAEQGHIDHLVRSAIRHGVAPELAYRAASLSVARHYGMRQLGAVAPGYRADLVLLDDPGACAISDVFKSGVPAAEVQAPGSVATSVANTVRARLPEARDLAAPEGKVHVIGVDEGSIITEHLVLDSHAKGVARLTVLERHGGGSKPANGYVTGFGEKLRGAIASSVGHDSHNLIVVGDDVEDMRAALGALIECGGGFCVVQDRAVKARLALPFGGLMSTSEPAAIERSLRELHAASKAIGCALTEPFLQLAFLSLPVIPSLKLTDKGLVDVEQFKIIDVRSA